jgi:hypothetical protein
VNLGPSSIISPHFLSDSRNDALKICLNRLIYRHINVLLLICALVSFFVTSGKVILNDPQDKTQPPLTAILAPEPKR